MLDSRHRRRMLPTAFAHGYAERAGCIYGNTAAARNRSAFLQTERLLPAADEPKISGNGLPLGASDRKVCVARRGVPEQERGAASALDRNTCTYGLHLSAPIGAAGWAASLIFGTACAIIRCNMSETKFHVDQKIVYPSQGVGKIIEIFTKNFRGADMLYYKIYIEASDMIVMVPVERAEELGIRTIVSAEEAQKALDMLSDEFEPITSDWKLRYQTNLDLLKKGSISDIATIVRCLYNRSKVKELPILERKLYDSAKKLLEDEVSFATGKSEKEVEETIHVKLEPPGAAPKVKQVVPEEDDEDEGLMDDLDGGKDSDKLDDDADELIDSSADDMGDDDD